MSSSMTSTAQSEVRTSAHAPCPYSYTTILQPAKTAFSHTMHAMKATQSVPAATPRASAPRRTRPLRITVPTSHTAPPAPSENPVSTAEKSAAENTNKSAAIMPVGRARKTDAAAGMHSAKSAQTMSGRKRTGSAGMTKKFKSIPHTEI